MNYKNNLISVIIPIYKVEKYLSRCLESVIGNTYKELEIICVNDGSPDHCREILDKYKQQDSRIIVIDKQNEGLSAARNSGLKAASGEFVAFIDSDDWIHPKYFEYLLRAINDYNADMSMCNFVRTKDEIALHDSEYNSRLVTVKDLAQNKFKLKVWAWARLFRRTAIETLYFDVDEKTEDADYIARFLLRNPNFKMADIDAVLYAYYIRGDSFSTRIEPKDILKISEKYLEYISSADSKDVKVILAEQTFKWALSARFNCIALGDTKRIRQSNAIIRKCLIYRLKISYIIAAMFPSIYRLKIIRTDPTLKIYENKLKQKNMNWENDDKNSIFNT